MYKDQNISIIELFAAIPLLRLFRKMHGGVDLSMRGSRQSHLVMHIGTLVVLSRMTN